MEFSFSVGKGNDQDYTPPLSNDKAKIYEKGLYIQLNKVLTLFSCS